MSFGRELVLASRPSRSSLVACRLSALCCSRRRCCCWRNKPLVLVVSVALTSSLCSSRKSSVKNQTSLCGCMSVCALAHSRKPIKQAPSLTSARPVLRRRHSRVPCNVTACDSEPVSWLSRSQHSQHKRKQASARPRCVSSSLCARACS